MNDTESADPDRTPVRTPDGDPLLRIRDLTVQFHSGEWGTAVDDLSLDIHAGRTLAIIGESGSGKSAMARSIMGVLPESGSRITSGRIELDGADLLTMSRRERASINGTRLAMVFQDAMSALNPVLPIRYQVAEGLRIHRGMSKNDAGERAVELLGQVGIPDPERRASSYPHELSGGMLQRVMIAMSISCDPDLLIADEPTTALDVTIQAQILDLLVDLKTSRDMGLVVITHDLGVVAGIADDMVVMYAGRIVERGTAAQVFDHPENPYTRALLDAIPRPEQRGGPLPMIGGKPPALTNKPEGCSFRPRCTDAVDECMTPADLVEVAPGHHSRCHLAEPAEPVGVAGPGRVDDVEVTS